MFKALTLAFLAFLTPALAQKETAEQTALFDKADWAKDKVIDCKSSPKEAVTKVPDLITGFARVICTKTGHQFIAKRGWHWHHQADGLPPFFISSAASKSVNGIIPEDVGNKGYFTKISAARVNYGANFGKIYPATLAQNPVLLAAHQAMMKANIGAIEITLTTFNNETMVIHVLDQPQPYDFAYVTTIPGTNAVVLFNDLVKVQAAQKQLQPTGQKK